MQPQAMTRFGPSLPLLLLGSLVSGAPAWAEPRAEPSAFNAARCLQRVEDARQELLRRGFHPTTDGDTARWLQVAWEGDVLSMSLVMRAAADGAQTGFFLALAPAKRSGATVWRLGKRALCCDDNHERSDNIVEHRWSRRGAGEEAEVSVHTIALALRDPEHRKVLDLFVEVGRRAADDCLRVP